MSDVTAGRNNGRRRVRGYASWAPRARARATLEQIEQVLEEYAGHLPLTVRQIFYRLVGAYGHPKTETFYEHLSDVLNRSRRSRRLPFAAIRDDGVTTVRHDRYSSLADFEEETARRIAKFELTRQEGQLVYLELWCEAGGMLGQLDRVAKEYGVQVYTNGRGNSTSANHEVAKRALGRNVPTVLLHVGDFDPHGEAIFGALADDAAGFVEEDRVIQTIRVEAVRAALTVEQVELYGLPTEPLKRGKTKAHATLNEHWRERYGDRTCQVEALAPDVLADVVRGAIEARLDLDVWCRRCEEEGDARAELLGLPWGDDDNDAEPF
jgi:hypothetical protein